jgi:two-component system, OmpR family, heavy metal sensor histidine kinase CusS
MPSAPTDAEQPLGQPVLCRRCSFYPRSFRALVAAWNTLTILLFAVALLIGLRYGLSYMMTREEDNLLSEDVAEVCLVLDRVAQNRSADDWERVQRFLDRKADSHSRRKWFGQIQSSDGGVLAQSNSVPDLTLPVSRTAGLATQTVGTYRVAQRRHRDAGSNQIVVNVGATTEGIEEDLTRLTDMILVAGVILLALAPVGGYWLAGRVIRPLSNMIARTAKLRPRNLDERLPIRETGDELDQLSVTINGLLDRIADYLDRHRELTANLAHELRSPLAAILSSAEVALNQERSSDEYKELLGSIVEESSRLGTLVQQLLMLAESDGGRLQRAEARVGLDLLAHKAVEMFRGVAESRGVNLEVHALLSVCVNGDAGQLRQVIFNLIDNAIKFTQRGFVHVDVRADAEGNGLVVVTDTGIGIPSEHLPHVFDRFYRGDQSRTRLATGGSGLGLSICKALVTAHGGTISIKSEVGHGTEVRVLLPCART